jgi:hypothetical protein
MNLLLNIPPEIARSIAAGDPVPDGLSEKAKAAYSQRKSLALAYLIEQATRPQTIGYSLADSPVGLASWMLDHDPHSYEQLSHAFEGHPEPFPFTVKDPRAIAVQPVTPLFRHF